MVKDEAKTSHRAMQIRSASNPASTPVVRREVTEDHGR
jgi:hypothetical protein